MEECTEKIREVRELIEAEDLDVDVQVDGGINDETMETVLTAGANLLVAGSYVFNDDLAKNVPFDSMQADFENGIYPQDVLVHGFKTLSEEEYGDEKSQYDNHATLLGYTSYKVVQVSLDEQWPDETKENITRQYAVGRSRKSWKIFEITEK